MQYANPKKIDPLFARFFTESTVRTLLKNGAKNSIFSEFQTIAAQLDIVFKGKTYQDFFEFAFDHLLRNYRSEYVYKNAIAKNILLGRHSLNTSFMLQEFRVGKCKADTVVLNGTSNVYEIKTELDSLDRLQNQIDTYLKVFDMVHVITFPGQTKKMEQSIPKCVGLWELTHRNTISEIRPAISGKSQICTSMLFDSLRKQEYKAILKKHFNYVPAVPNTEEYAACRELFVTIPADIAHDLAVVELKKRGNSLALRDFVSGAPEYFKALSLNARFSKKETDQLKELLSSDLTFA